MSEMLEDPERRRPNPAEDLERQKKGASLGAQLLFHRLERGTQEGDPRIVGAVGMVREILDGLAKKSGAGIRADG